MRGYSLRSAYPLARSSQSRRRLMLLYNLNNSAADDEESEYSAPPAPHAWDPDEAGENDPTQNTDELRHLFSQNIEETESLESEDDYANAAAFIDDIFQDAEERNDALAGGRVSESVLDDDEDEAADSMEESLLTSLGEESMIHSGSEEESRVLSMADLQDLPSEELPGSNPPSDRKPHFPSWYVPNFKTVKRLLDGEKPVTWMFAGESSTSAADLAQGRRNFTDHFSERVRTELGRMLDVVINTGSAGETCENLLANLEWRVLRFHPEVVSIMIGRNDSIQGKAGRQAFQDHLEQIVQAIRDSGSILILHTPNRVDTTKAEPFHDLRSYVRIIRDVSKSFNVPLVDHWEHWKEQKPEPESLRAWLSADGVMPGVYGQREIAKVIFRVFEIYDPESPVCSARVP